MKKIFALILAVAMVACMFAGCSKDNNKTDAKEILVIVKNSTAPFWISVMDGAKAAGAELGYTVTCKTPVDTAEGSGNEQQSNLCEEAIVSGVSCVVLAPVDSEAIIPATKKINEAGIPIVNLNTKISDDTQYKTFCGLENINQGYNTAKAMFELMNGEGKIFIIEGSTGAQTSIDRVKGFEKALAEYPNIEVVAQQSANYSRADALNVVQNLLQAHPDVNAILCCNDEMALGSAEAIDAANLTGTIMVSGQDANDDAVAALKEGKITVTSYGNPYMQGYTAVKAAVDVLEGKSVESFYEVETVVVTKENADTFKNS
ncbi:MAG: sugar ABC transporter substrate-binding protein [Clostridiales bacterium]|nr:sugar ABC transporter substrate-binding protein [Clostridiales bacterium]